MAGIQQKRKNLKSFKKRRKVIPVLIPKKGQNQVSIKKSASVFQINYKNLQLLVNFISPQGKILSRRATGLTAKQQRVMATAIKRARMGGLLPFVNYDITAKTSF